MIAVGTGQTILKNLHSKRRFEENVGLKLVEGGHPKIRRQLVDVTAELFLIIYQRSWECEKVPAGWKLASVFPIYRKGGREDPGKFRPVGPT